MSILKKIRHKARTAKGAAKKSTGRVTGNRRLKTEGRTDQATGNIEQATDKVKDAFKHWTQWHISPGHPSVASIFSRTIISGVEMNKAYLWSPASFASSQDPQIDRRLKIAVPLRCH
jgi:uncharacterized protein YjbJ (UPF0337 family)